jgi:hypothetical protein
MKTNEVFPSKFLKAEDETFALGEVVATIKDVSKEIMQGKKGEEDKPVMYFRELQKGLVMNKTNWGTCEKLFASDESDDWIGHKVILAAIETVAFGEPVKGIRILDKKPADRAALLVRYTKLYERGVKVNLEGITDYAIGADMSEQEIIDLGRELKAKIEAAEAF